MQRIARARGARGAPRGGLSSRAIIIYCALN
jgi:hypothetical protein